MAAPKGPTKAQLRREEEKKVLEYLKSRALEEQGVLDARTARTVSVTAARQMLFLEQFRAMSKEVFAGKLAPSGYSLKPRSKRKAKRILNMLLSDLHIGARLEKRELPIPFGPEEEARRLAHIVMNTVEYKTDHRDETELNLYLAGDVIEGLLMHELRSGAPLVEQAVAFMRHILQALLILAAHFPFVRVYCQTGNHGRNKLIHPNRATHMKYDSNEGIMYYAIQTAVEFGRIPNVTVDVPFTPYCAVPLFNHWAMVLHGDMGPVNFGNPGSSIPVSNIEKQIAQINSTKIYTCAHPRCREKHGGHEYAIVAGGHVHTGAHVFLAGADVIINPALIPSNQHALALGYVSACGQRIWESVEDHPMGDSRLIKVGLSQDKDSKLDKIIAPYRLGEPKPFYFPQNYNDHRRSSRSNY
jgi:hypothetical protein